MRAISASAAMSGAHHSVASAALDASAIGCVVRIARGREIVYAHSPFCLKDRCGADFRIASRRLSRYRMVFLLRSLGRLPLATLYGFAWIVYFVTFHLLRWRRDMAVRNLARSFPEKSPAERAAILQQAYRNMSEVFVELLWGWRASADELTGATGHGQPGARRALCRRAALGDPAHRARVQLGMAVARRRRALRHPDRCRVQADARGQRRCLHARGAQPLRRPADPDQAASPSNCCGAPGSRGRTAWWPTRRRSRHGQALDALPESGHGVLRRRGKNRPLPRRARSCYVAMRRLRRGYYAVHLHVLAEPPYDGARRRRGAPAPAGSSRPTRANWRRKSARSPADWLWVAEQVEVSAGRRSKSER